MSAVSEVNNGNGSDVGDNAKTAEVVVSRIKSRSRRSCGTIFMEVPDDIMNLPGEASITPAKSEVKNETTTVEKLIEVPVKRSRGRPKLTEEVRKARPKPKRRKRKRSESEDDDDSNSDSVASVNVQKTGSKKYTRAPVKRTSSGTPTKLRGRLASSEDEEFGDLSDLLKRQSISRRNNEVKPIKKHVKDSEKQSRKGGKPKSFSELTLDGTTASSMSPAEHDHAISVLPSEPRLWISHLFLPEALTFTDKFFINQRRCFLIRNYFKVRAYVKTLTRTSVRKLKKREPARSLLISRAKIEAVIGKMKNTITAHFRAAVQPNAMDETELRIVLKQGLFLRRNYEKVRTNCSVASMDFNEKKTPKKSREGKNNEIIDKYFKQDSVGFHAKGRLDNPLVLVLQ